jgi:hypothetical protein
MRRRLSPGFPRNRHKPSDKSFSPLSRKKIQTSLPNRKKTCARGQKKMEPTTRFELVTYGLRTCCAEPRRADR